MLPGRDAEQSVRPAQGNGLGVWFFLALAFGISWGTFALRRAATWPEPIDEFLRLTIKFGPSLAGLLAALHVSGLAGLKSLLGRLVIPCPRPGWLAIAFLLPIAILLVALAGRVLIGGSVLPAGSLTFVEASGLFFTLLATRFFLGGGLGEELGWRGFMLPTLQPRMGPLKASLVIGLCHGAWHLPAYGGGVVLLMVFTVSGALVFTWMYNRTGGNLLLPALMHATANASLPFLETLFPAIDQEMLFPLLVLAVWAAVAGAIAFAMPSHGTTADR